MEDEKNKIIKVIMEKMTYKKTDYPGYRQFMSLK